MHYNKFCHTHDEPRNTFAETYRTNFLNAFTNDFNNSNELYPGSTESHTIGGIHIE